MLKGRLPLILAVVLGVTAGILAYLTVEQKKAEVQKGWDLVEIVVADEDVEEGAELKLESLSKRSVPSQFVTRSVIRPDQLDRNAIGRTLVMSMKAGDPLTWAHFQTNRGFERLASVVDKTLRAVAIRVTNESSVSNMVRPNDHVDVVATMRNPTTGDLIAVTLLQNVTVLSTGKLTYASNLTALSEEDKMYTTVTLQVLPEEAEILILGQELGSMYMTLRNPEDLSSEDNRTHTNQTTILTGDRSTLLKKRTREGIQVIRGK